MSAAGERGGAPFGETRAGPARLYALRAGATEALVCDYGARIVSVRHASSPNLVLSLPDAGAYEADEGYLGAVVGRVANRVAGARAVLDDRTLMLAANEGPNQLHGGPGGFSWRRWEVAAREDDRLTLRLVSDAGDQGFPGTVKVNVSFHVKPSELHVAYEAETTAPTPFGLTHHAYWNLAGKGDVLAHQVASNADRTTPTTPDLLFTGEVASVAGTPLDLRGGRSVGEVERGTGMLDANLVAPEGEGAGLRLRDPASGRTLAVTSDAPCLQLYAGKRLKPPHIPHAGLAVEPQDWPDGLNHAAFPDGVLRPGTPYRRRIAYALG